MISLIKQICSDKKNCVELNWRRIKLQIVLKIQKVFFCLFFCVSMIKLEIYRLETNQRGLISIHTFLHWKQMTSKLKWLFDSVSLYFNLVSSSHFTSNVFQKFLNCLHVTLPLLNELRLKFDDIWNWLTETWIWDS